MFICGSLPVTVTNAVTGEVFYQSPKGSKGVFSVPKGTWIFDKPCKQIEFRRKLPVLPKKERTIPKPSKWFVIHGPNPAKCTINLESGKILIDTELFNKLSDIERKFIFLHEYGHYYYKTEHYCDLFAKRALLKLGYNRSQVAAVDIGILGNGKSSLFRKNWTFEKIRDL